MTVSPAIRPAASARDLPLGSTGQAPRRISHAPVSLPADASVRERARAYERWLAAEAARAEEASGEEEPDSPAGYAARASEEITAGERVYRPFAPFRAVYSALRTFTTGQVVALGALGLALAAALALNWSLTLMGLLAALTAFYLLDLAITAALVTRTLRRTTTVVIEDAVARAVRDGFWPTYTVLCPLYHEAEVAEQFVRAMRLIDYPTDRLQALFLVEEEDEETRAALLAMGLPAHFEVITVPDGKPRTKPRACNYGLMRATGDFIVIFDAEDIPDPLQLKKAALTFAHYGPELACAQASLSFYNPHQNALTRWFTAEYALWFGLTLPALRRANTFLPLGGTSNHFRTRVLREVGGWDPFNVTEDCDLGVRLAHYHYTTAMVDSTTWEEANPDLKNWVRQRSRWIKGYMQTYLTHMRHPPRYARERRLGEFFWLQIIVGGRTATQLINPLLWAMTLAYALFPVALVAPYHTLYPAPVFYAAAFCLVAGNLFYIYLYVIGCLSRGHYTLTLWSLAIPLYWALMSVAAYIALYQLLTRPHYWEKTRHGLSYPRAASRFSLTLSLDELRPALAVVAGLSGDLAAIWRRWGGALSGAGGLGRVTSGLAFGPLKAASRYASDELARTRRETRMNRAREARVAPSLALPVAPVVDMFSTVLTAALAPAALAPAALAAPARATAPSLPVIAIPAPARVIRPARAARPAPAAPVTASVAEALAPEASEARPRGLPVWLGWLRDGWLVAALLTAIVASATACVYFFTHLDLLLYNDAESHMMIARRVFDSATPGLAQLGSNWLPLPHILMWPFVWNDYLWQTGLAGTFAAAPCYVVAAVYTFLCAREITGNGAASYVGALALILNPNILYLQTTPLSEATLLAVTAATCYYFLRWARGGALTLLSAAFCALLGVMTRYEGWSFFAALTLMVIVVDLARRASLRQTLGDVVVFATPSAAGILLWLGWDDLLTGNPRYFQNGPYSPSAQQLTLRNEGLLPTYHHVWLDIVTLGADLIQYFGPLVIGLGVVGLAVFLASNWRRPVGVASLALLAPIALYLVSLYSGQTVIYAQGVMPANIHNPIFNVRYATSAALPLAMFLAHLVQRWRWAPILLAAVILTQSGLTARGGIISLQDGEHGVSCLAIQPADVFLLEHYNGGRVLVDSFNDTHDFATLRIDLANVIYEGNNTLWHAALADPARYAQWVIVTPHDLVAQSVDIYSHRFTDAFILVEQDAHGTRIYYRRGAPPLPTRAIPAGLIQAHAACGAPGASPRAPSSSPRHEGPHALIAPPVETQPLALLEGARA